MLLRTYTKEEVNEIIKKEINIVKSEFEQIVNELRQENKLLINNIEEIQNNYKILLNTKITKLEEQIQTNSNDLVDTNDFLNMEIESTQKLIDTKVNYSIEKIKDEMEDLIYKNNLTCDQILVGYTYGIGNAKLPFFVSKYINLKNYSCVNGYYSILSYINIAPNMFLILESLEILCTNKNFYFELYSIYNIIIIDKKGNIIRNYNNLIDINNDKSLKIIKNYLDKISVKIYYNGSEKYNGELVSNIIDKIK